MRRVALMVIAALIASPLTTAAAAPTRLRRGPSPTVAASDALALAFQNGRLTKAQYALERARSVFHLADVRAEYGDVARPDKRAVTSLLTELALSVRDLSGLERRRANDLLARPTTGRTQELGQPGFSVREETPLCDRVCVHYVASTDDAPASPTWPSETLAVFGEVWEKEINDMGFRAPKSDSASTPNGGNGLLDVYIQDIGNYAYGYCTTDDPKTNTRTVNWNFSAYCVVDNDYAPDQFRTGASGSNALRATAAHEFFHAVQYGYDAGEDAWLKEATATWMEDEVYDDINDNVVYLPVGPLAHPEIPLDKFFDPLDPDPLGSFPYGSWIFFRSLSEQPNLGAESILHIWQALDSRTADHDDVYSVQAIQRTAAAEGTSLRDLYAGFAAKAVAPGAFFEEGAANLYPSAPVPTPIELTTAAPTAPSRLITLDHLTSRYVSFTPGADTPADGKMTIAVDLPDLVRGSEATAVIQRLGVDPELAPLRLDDRGKGQLTVDFGHGVVERVVLVLSNGSSRFKGCWVSRTDFSCAGTPVDDNMPFAFAAQLGTVAPPVQGGDPPRDTTPPRITNVSDGPDPFRVNGTRLLKINFRLGELSAAFKAEIRDSSGTRVFGLAETNLPAGGYTIKWNGVYRRQLIKAGKYTYKLSAVDAAGNRSAVKKGTFIVKR